MESGKRKNIERVIGLVMVVMMLVTSNSVVMAAETAWQTESERFVEDIVKQDFEIRATGTGDVSIDTEIGDHPFVQKDDPEGPVSEERESKEELLEKEEMKENEGIEKGSEKEVNVQEAAEGEAGVPSEISVEQPRASEVSENDIFEYRIDSSNNTATITKYLGDESAAFLIIPGKIDVYTVVGIGYEAFRDQTALLEVDFPESLATIERNAFYGCSGLRSVEFPSSMRIIGSEAFRDCNALAQISLNEDLQEIGSDAFASCGELTEVRFPASLAAVGNSGAFASCGKLEKVTFVHGIEKIPAYTCRQMQNLKTVAFENGTEEKSKIAVIGDSAFYDCTALEEISFPESLVTIERNAFYGCSSLRSAEFPSSLRNIGSGAFCDCGTLAQIQLNEGLEELGSNAFASCGELTEVRFPASLTIVGSSGAFVSCGKLEKVTFSYGIEKIPSYACRQMSSLQTIVYEGRGSSDSKVTAIGDHAFANCTALQALTLPKALIDIGQNAFRDCVSLVAVEFPESLTAIENYAFYNCTSLYEIILPESLEQIGSYVFSSCSNATIFYIGKKVFEIGANAFYVDDQTETMLFTENDHVKKYAWENDRRNISAAEELYKAGANVKAGIFDNGMFVFIGTGAMDDWTADTQPWKSKMKDISGLYIGKGIRSIGNYMLAGSSLTDLILEEGALTSIGNSAFDGCNNLTYIEFGEGITRIGAHAFRATGASSVSTVVLTQNVLAQTYDWAGDNRRLEETAEVYKLNKYVAAYVSGKVLTIRGHGMLPDYSSGNMPWKDWDFTSVSILKGIRRIGDNSFYGLESIQSVRVPDGLESIGDHAFYNCKAITEMILPKSVDSLGQQVFFNCESLVSVNLGDTGVGTVPYSAFENCLALRVVRLPDSAERVEDSAFKNCMQLNSLTLPEGVSHLGREAFYGCERLTSVLIPRSLSSVESTNEGGPFAGSGLTSASFAARTREVLSSLFWGCGGLQTVKLPGTVSEIGTYAFYGCMSLTKIQFPKLLYSIGDHAFYGCKGLEDIQWPEDLQEIGDHAFYECTSIKELPYLAYLENIGSYAFYGCEDLAKVEFGENITQIQEGSFYKNNLKTVHLSYKVGAIGSKAFAENHNLTLLTIPAYTQTIAEDILEDGASFITIGGSADSEAEKFAQDRGYMFRTQEGISAQQAELSKANLTLAVDQEATIRLSLAPAWVTDKITWESDNETVASVVEDGSDPSQAVIRARGAGKAKIQVKIGMLMAVCEVGVGNYVTDVTLDQTYIRMTAVGDRVDMRADITPTDAEDANLVWKTSDKNIAVVEVKKDADGNEDPSEAVVAAVGNGVARITVSTMNGAVKRHCFVHVNAAIPVEDVHISEEELLLTRLGKSRRLSAVVLPESASNQKVQWSSSNEAVAMVDQQGRVTPSAEGMAEITVMTEDGGKTASCVVTVRFVQVPVTGVSLNETAVTLEKIGTSAQLTAQVQPSSADIQDVQWLSADEKVASVDMTGKVTANGGGATVITARTRDGGFEESCQITVKSLIATIFLDRTRLQIRREEAAQLTAQVAPYSTAVEWYSTNTKIAKVDKTGLVTGVSEGLTTVKCRAVDGTNITAVCWVAVGEDQQIPGEKEQKVTGVTLNKTTARLEAAGRITLKAMVTPSNAADKKLKWTSNNEQVAVVSQKGVVTTKKPGKAVITVQSVMVPDQKSTCTITVTKPKVAKVRITSVKAGKRQLKVKWKKVTAAGYQVQYSRKKNFSSKRILTVSGRKKAQKKITKLRSGRRYYVRVRAYKTINGQKYYGKWSTVKNKKVK